VRDSMRAFCQRRPATQLIRCFQHTLCFTLFGVPLYRPRDRLKAELRTSKWSLFSKARIRQKQSCLLNFMAKINEAMPTTPDERQKIPPRRNFLFMA